MRLISNSSDSCDHDYSPSIYHPSLNLLPLNLKNNKYLQQYKAKNSSIDIVKSKKKNILPDEIISRILRHCNDKQTLLECRLSCRLLANLVFQNLLQYPKISTRNHLEKLLLIQQSSDVSRFIKGLDLSKRSALISPQNTNHLSQILDSSVLKSLNLSRIKLSSPDLQSILSKIDNLESLCLDNCQQVVDGTFKNVKFTRLRKLSLLECKYLSNGVFRYLALFPRLSDLQISLAKKITGRGFAEIYLGDLNTMEDGAKLTRILFRSCGKWQDEDLEDISKKCLKLKSLELVGNSGSISSEAIYKMLMKLDGTLESVSIAMPLAVSPTNHELNRPLIFTETELDDLQRKFRHVSISLE